jgi:hypothetical protein
VRIENDTTSLPDDDRSLDRLLGEAQWPDVDATAVNRLRTTLAAQSIRRTAKSRQWWGVAIAASVGIMLIGAAMFFRPHHSSPQIAEQQPPKQMIVAAATVTPIIVRPANEYECAILLANSTAHSASKSVVNPSLIKPPQTIAESSQKNDPALLLAQNNPASIGKFLELVQDPSTRDSALDALRKADQPPVDLLLAEMNAPLISRRYDAARALGCLCHGPTFAALQQRVEQNVDRREAMIALLYCPNPAAKEYLGQLRTQPVLAATLKSVQSQIQTIF